VASLERILNDARRLNERDLEVLHREVSRLCAPLYRKKHPGHWETGMAAAKSKIEAARRG
jgi:hypothetical protein